MPPELLSPLLVSSTRCIFPAPRTSGVRLHKIIAQMLSTMLWRQYSANYCCLCGSSGAKLTCEHKIKASALRKQFGTADLLVGVSGSSEKMRAAQSTNSKHLKFEASLCEDCNSSRTQEPDREFDRFHEIALSKLSRNEDPVSTFDLPQYAEGSDGYLNVFRYFAKLLCCQIAAINGPTPIAVAKFAIGENVPNRIWLELKRDPFYNELIQQIGQHGYAAHGGLVVYADKEARTPNAFHSTLTVGAIQYVFHSRLSDIEKYELSAQHDRFCEWCRVKVGEAIDSPIPEGIRDRLGLAVSGTGDAAHKDQDAA